jgi:putative transposase
MPRRPRLNLTGLPLHIVQRGNNRSACFFAKEDYSFCLLSLGLLSAKHRCSIHAYALMTNHIHLLLTPAEPTGASRLMQALGRRYVPYINRLYKRSGTLFEGRFKASVVNAEEYLLRCYCYIDLNPIRAQAVKHPADYPWSSCRHHAIEECSDIVRDHPLYDALHGDPTKRREIYAALLRTELDPQVLGTIRTAANRGQALGNHRFRVMIQSALADPARPHETRPCPGADSLDGAGIESLF